MGNTKSLSCREYWFEMSKWRNHYER